MLFLGVCLGRAAGGTIVCSAACLVSLTWEFAKKEILVLVLWMDIEHDWLCCWNWRVQNKPVPFAPLFSIIF